MLLFQKLRTGGFPVGRLVFLLPLLTLAFISRGTTLPARATGFRAAVVKVDITPEKHQVLQGYGARLSSGINDRIFHRAVVMDDGKTEFVIVSSEICVLSPSEYDKVAAELSKELGIDRMNFWWSVTHTHSAPYVGSPGLVLRDGPYKGNFEPEYSDIMKQKLIDAVREARKNLAPARLGVGWGHSQANINRRAKGVDGKAFLGMDPDGAVDRRIGLIRLEKADGSPLALLGNYPIHGTVLGSANLLISGDAPGVVSEYVEAQVGVPLLFINGAAGNLAPIYSVYPSPQAGKLHQFKVLLGDKIIDANKNLKATTDQVTLKTGGITVETPKKEGLGLVSYLNNYTRTTKAGVNLIKLPVRFLNINDDIAIWSAPLELFCEISNEIRDRSPFPYTFYYGYTNGWLGYLLTEAEIPHEGYEVTVSPYSPSAAKDLTDAVVNHLQGKK